MGCVAKTIDIEKHLWDMEESNAPYERLSLFLFSGLLLIFTFLFGTAMLMSEGP
jgi:hypothetical protein